MKARVINFPATTLDAAEALGVDVERFCIESLRRLVESMERNMKAVATKQIEEVTSKGGRPVKRSGRIQVTLQLEPDNLQQVDRLATSLCITRPDAVNLVLETATSEGIFQRLAKKTT